MSWTIWLIAALMGYLLGSISFARIIFDWKRPGEKFPAMTYKIPQSDVVFTSTSTGATTIFETFGSKWGGITALFDILKAFLPALAFRLLFPESLVFLIYGFFAIVGHNYPLYYKFKGGRGSSTISGVLLVLDWFGSILTAFLGIAMSVLFGNVTISRWLGRILMIPYVWLVHRNVWYVFFVVAVNLLFFGAMHDELKQISALKAANLLPDQETIAEINGIGSLHRLSQKISFPSLLRRLGIINERTVNLGKTNPHS